jgi:acyl-CoA reductase-like NAD-dependent aldehyde dehydrogenase/nicotinamidase-related amidase
MTKSALCLIEFQQQFLDRQGLTPPAEAICASTASLLQRFRQRKDPIIHIWTTISDEADDAPDGLKPNSGYRVEHTANHQVPSRLLPRAGESIFQKRFCSGFSATDLEAFLESQNVETLVLTGMRLESSIATTALDAHHKKLSVIVAEEAAGGDDPIHAAITRQYLMQRSIRFLHNSEILDQVLTTSTFGFRSVTKTNNVLPAAIINGDQIAGNSTESSRLVSPSDGVTELFTVATCQRQDIAKATHTSSQEIERWQRTKLPTRCQLWQDIAKAIEEQAEGLAQMITRDVGKPILDARMETRFAIELIRSAIESAQQATLQESTDQWRGLRRAQGVVALITPWNNPLAIPIGKLAPALLYGNGVVWKPSVHGASIANSLFRLLQDRGVPDGLINLVNGGRDVAENLIREPTVDAVSLTGSHMAGAAAQLLAAKRHVPFQGELGGNNTAIVMPDADMELAVEHITGAAFGNAGQRCTAVRRILVHHDCFEAFSDALCRSVSQLNWGDPFDESTQIGPVISAAAMTRLQAILARAEASGAELRQPLEAPRNGSVCEQGYYFPPTVIVETDRQSEVASNETFGPILVMHQVEGWIDALELCNQNSMGLVASLYTRSRERIGEFLRCAQAGMLKVNHSPAGANPSAPFCAWKRSGFGPPEHGKADVEFYTRWQVHYYNADFDTKL